MSYRNKTNENTILGGICIGMLIMIACLLCNPVRAQVNPLGQEFKFTLDSTFKNIMRVEHNGSYTLSMDIKTGYKFGSRKWVTLCSYGYTTITLRYPTIIFSNNNDRWELYLTDMIGWSVLTDGGWHRLTYRVNATTKEFLIDSILIGSRKAPGDNPINAPLYLSAPNYKGIPMPGNLDDNIYSFDGSIRNVTFAPAFIKHAKEKTMPEPVWDYMEFHPAYIPGSNDYSAMPSPVAQLYTFQTPKFKDSTSYTGLAWDLSYFVGKSLPKQEQTNYMLDVQKYLSQYFRYSIMITNHMPSFYEQRNDTNSIGIRKIALARAMSWVPCSFYTVWHHISPIGSYKQAPAERIPVTTPVSAFADDRYIFQQHVGEFKRLTKGLKMRDMNDNGEHLSFNPTPQPQSSIAYAEICNYVWAETMRDSFPGISYGQYDVYALLQECCSEYRFNEMMAMNSYPTPQCYYKYGQSDWYSSTGAPRGFFFYLREKANEIEAGYTHNIPYLALGYNMKPEDNICPSNGLAIAKLMRALKYKWIYDSYWTDSRTGFQDYRTCAWQLTSVPYAEACFSKWDKYFTNSTLMPGDMLAEYYLQPGAKPVFYPGCYWSGNNEVVTIVESQDSLYRITTARFSPHVYITPGQQRRIYSTIVVAGDTIRFWSRKQGSQYIYNKNTKQIIAQTDQWTRVGHPSRWGVAALKEEE